MKIRQNGSWSDTNLYIRKNGQWVYINNVKDANEFLLIISQTTTDLNLQTAFDNAFGVGAWTSTKRKRVIINSGVVIGATSPLNYALTIPSGVGGSLTIANNGYIQGAGGAANGGTGGNAIFAGSSGVIFINLGTIYAGGGGGGSGGTGGAGSYAGLGANQFLGASGWYYGIGANYGTRCAAVCGYTFGASYANVFPSISRYQNPASGCGGCDCCNDDAAQSANVFCCYGQPYTTLSSAGGAGGNGGIGQGYLQSATTGASGSAGGTNAGTGGTGGTGGGWGASGGNGGIGGNGNAGVGTSGGSGGLAGYYIVNNGNIIWTTTGTVAGRVG